MHQDLVKRLRELHPEEFGDAWDFAFACQQAMHEAADVIEKMSKPRWISVEERLPEENVKVLGLIPLPQIGGPPALQVLWYVGDGKWQLVWNADTIRSPVTHWMPLPSTEGLSET